MTALKKRGGAFHFLLGGKRGISPVVATTLLVSITIILAVIVFFWARSFISETIEKNDRAIEMSCDDVAFLMEARRGNLTVNNIGDVPIWAVEMRVRGKGEIKEIGQTSDGIKSGETKVFALPAGASPGDTIIAVPILLGETEQKRLSYICDADYGISTEYEF